MNPRAAATRMAVRVLEQLTADEEPRSLDAAYDYAARLTFEIDCIRVARAGFKRPVPDVVAKALDLTKAGA